MQLFLDQYTEAVLTTLGFFWMAFWAFSLGYFVSSIIQVFVTHERMKQAMGKENFRSIGLGTFFGFISSSCSFAALATTRSLFRKGAGFIPSLAFLLSSTNLVIELGIIISVFLSWQFVAGEYIGGLMLIIFMWILVKIKRPSKAIKIARERLNKGEENHQLEMMDQSPWSMQTWKMIAMQYLAEWKMVWKDVTIGFTIAGIIAVFVPSSFFQSLFIPLDNLSGINYLLAIIEHSLIGPVAAFFTFIGSMGNIPLAAVLYANGVSFAGIMAFIFSDLVVFPVLRINAKYYGWRLAIYILSLLLISLILTSVLLHFGLLTLGLLPEIRVVNIMDQDLFQVNYTFFLNLLFLIISLIMAGLKFFGSNKMKHHHGMADKGILEPVLTFFAIISYIWLGGGLVVQAYLSFV
jgi:uncharacterized membrane protein YraQ (UPF0718 family)